MKFSRPPGVHLGNWREQPFSPWSFQHVNELVPSAVIRSGRHNPGSTSALGLEAISGAFPLDSENLEVLLKKTGTDALRVDLQGNCVAGWFADHFDPNLPHLLFSVSKSITAIVAGILQDQGLLDAENPVSHYLDLPHGSAYAEARVQHVLDMTVSIDFEENYTSEAIDYLAYRRASGWNPVDQTRMPGGLAEFIPSLQKLDGAHGEVFRYRSPNSDLLGLILESATGRPFNILMSDLLWQPIGATSDAYITVDHFGAPRTAGGICATLDDVQRLAQTICDGGKGPAGNQVIPADWIHEINHGGSPEAWRAGDLAFFFPGGKYRNKWYQSGNTDNTIYAMGIHGQYIYINPTRNIVITRLASQHLPVDEPVEAAVVQAFDLIAERI